MAGPIPCDLLSLFKALLFPTAAILPVIVWDNSWSPDFVHSHLTTLLAIDTATEALSVAIRKDGELSVFHERLPRLHQQRIFEALQLLLGATPVAKLGLKAVVYGKGPGSFTGLRIAASAAQGLGYSLSLPVIGISTLATQARTLIRRQSIQSPCIVISTIDARIGQTYVQCFDYDGSTLTERGPAKIRQAEDVSPLLGAPSELPVLAIGDGVQLLDPAVLASCGRVDVHADLLPEAQDMLEAAELLLKAGSDTDAASAYPDYVQQEIGWKKLSEQGPKS